MTSLQTMTDHNDDNRSHNPTGHMRLKSSDHYL